MKKIKLTSKELTILEEICKSRNLDLRDYFLDFVTQGLLYAKSKPGEHLKPLVLAVATSGGKTEMMFILLELLHRVGLLKGRRILFVAASKGFLRDNISERMVDFKPGFSYATITAENSKQEISNILGESGPDVVIALPQGLIKNLDLMGNFWGMLLDEAHEWYFADVVPKIKKKISPQFELLATGTPFRFHQNKELYNFFYISGMQLHDKGFIHSPQIEIVSSTLSFKVSDFVHSGFESLKSQITNTSKENKESLRNVCKEMLKKIKNPVKKSQDFNSLTKNVFSVFNLIDKTLLICRNTSQADDFFKELNSFSELNGKVLISHSEGDSDSKNFKIFKKQKEFKILIVVDRGKLGYSVNDLYNIVDFTYTQNLAVMVQILGRLFRIDKEKPFKQKIYYKVSPHKMSLYYEDIMTAVLCLCTDEWFKFFNLKNMGEIPVPSVRKEKKNSKKKADPEEKKKQVENKKVSLEELEIPLDLELFSNKVLHKTNNPFTTISWTTLGEARRKFFELKRMLKEVEPEVLELYHNGENLSDADIARKLSISSHSVSLIRRSHNLDSWTAESTSENEKKILETYEKNKGLSNSKIANLTGVSRKTVDNTLKKHNLEFQVGKAKTERYEKDKIEILKMYHNGKNHPSIEISEILNISPQTVSKVLKDEGLKPWTDLLNKKTTRSSYEKKLEEIKSKVLQIHGDGRKLSNRLIGTELNISPVTVAKYLKGANLKSWDLRNKFTGKRNTRSTN